MLAGVAFLLSVGAPVAALAQTAADSPDYVGTKPPDVPRAEFTPEVTPQPQVLGVSAQQTPEVAPAVRVLGTSAGRSAPAAPAGLPVTGADVVGLTAIAAAAIALGTVLVRRSRLA